MIELLVVIGIIAVLISLLLPSLNAARRQARTVQCAAAMRQFGIANLTYMNEQKGWCVPVKTAAGANTEPKLYGTLTYVPWYMNQTLRKALGVPFPPITKTGAAGAYSTTDWVANWPRGLLCPEAVWSTELDNPPGQITHCFGFNRETLGHIGDPAFTRTATQAFNAGLFVRINQVHRPAEKMQMIDGNWFYLDGVAAGTPADYRTGWDIWGDRFPNGSSPPIMISYRHKQGANVLFYDGHVGWLSKKDIFNTDPTNGPTLNGKLWNIILN